MLEDQCFHLIIASRNLIISSTWSHSRFIALRNTKSRCLFAIFFSLAADRPKAVHRSRMPTLWPRHSCLSALFTRAASIAFKGPSVSLSFALETKESFREIYWVFLWFTARDDKGNVAPVEVFARAYIYFLQNLEAHDLQFKMQALLQLRYVDPRLVFREVSKRQTPIVGEDDLRKELWVPHIFFANEKWVFVVQLRTFVVTLWFSEILASLEPTRKIFWPQSHLMALSSSPREFKQRSTAQWTSESFPLICSNARQFSKVGCTPRRKSSCTGKLSLPLQWVQISTWRNTFLSAHSQTKLWSMLTYLISVTVLLPAITVR